MDDHRLTLNEARLLVDQFKLPLGDESPLADLRDVQPAIDLQSVSRRGLLAEPWRAAMMKLAQADSRVQIVTPGPQSTKLAGYYRCSSLDAGQFVGCWAEENMVRISFPWSVDDLLDSATEVLGLTSLPPAESFSARLSVAGLFALAACVDVMRQRAFSELLERRAPAAAVLSEAELAQQLATGVQHGDARWSATLIRLLLPAQTVPFAGDVRAGLVELVTNGLLSEDTSGWRARDPLLALAQDWATPLPAMAHQVLGLQLNQLVHHQHIIAIRGGGPLWLLEFTDLLQADDALALRSVSGPVYRDHLERMLGQLPVAEPGSRPTAASSPARSAQVSEQARAEVHEIRDTLRCASCGQEGPAEAKFCLHCGAATNTEPEAHGSREVITAVEIVDGSDLDAVAPKSTARRVPQPTISRMSDANQPSVCPQCGKQMQGRKFCTGCGASVATNVPQKQTSRCARCGAVRKPDLQFCTSCGSRF